MEAKFRVSSSPHIRSKETVSTVMRDVIIALLPATLAGIFYFGIPALMTIALAIGTAVLTEWFIQKIMFKKGSTVKDLSAVVTGLLLAMNLPATTPWYIPVLGSIFAIAIVKQAFGGLGFNFMNPALGARAFLMASWPNEMTTWVVPKAVDGVTGATPLAIIKAVNAGSTEVSLSELPSFMNALTGNIGGCLGETSALLLILGGLYLVYRGVIDIKVPLTFIGTTFAVSFLIGGFDVTLSVYQVITGGLMLGAFFMATDYASTPINLKGKIVFAFGCGFITAIIRQFGGYPEGVSYSILLMNVAAPLIEKYTKAKVFGGDK
jgi:electron transport complex protein RnfD